MYVCVFGLGGGGVMCTPDTGSAACFCSEPTDFSLVCSGERSLRHLLVACRDTHSSILFLPRACWITQYLHNRIHRLHIIKNNAPRNGALWFSGFNDCTG